MHSPLVTPRQRISAARYHRPRKPAPKPSFRFSRRRRPEPPDSGRSTLILPGRRHPTSRDPAVVCPHNCNCCFRIGSTSPWPGSVGRACPPSKGDLFSRHTATAHKRSEIPHVPKARTCTHICRSPLPAGMLNPAQPTQPVQELLNLLSFFNLHVIVS